MCTSIRYLILGRMGVVCVIFNDSFYTSLKNGVLIINLMLFGKIISLDYKNHTKNINTQYGQNADFINVNLLKPSGFFTYDQV